MSQLEKGNGDTTSYAATEPFNVPITRVATALQRAITADSPLPLADALRSVHVDEDDIATYNMSAPLGSSLVLTGHALGGAWP